MNREHIILTALLCNAKYCGTVMPFLKSEYFHEPSDNTIFKCIHEFHKKYGVMPTKTALTHEAVSTSNDNGIQQELASLVDMLYSPALENDNLDWLLHTTEQFCREKAAYKAIMTAIDIYDGNETRISETAIPDMMREAVNITFDTTVGHDWADNAHDRFEFYHDATACIPFDIEALNAITEGHGVPRKTLNIIMAGVNCGKTGFMCHLAASYARQGLNVLYITMEMREELISKRLDANLLGVPLDQIGRLEYEPFMGKVAEVQQKTFGKIIVKEYPTGVAHSGHFNHLIREIKDKRGIKLDVVIVDYLGICASARASASSNSYTIQKNISEELRGLFAEHDVVGWTAVQLNRGGFDASDVEMTDIADSFGVAASADAILALTRTEELDEVNQVLIKQIKSRYGNKSDMLRFTIGVDQSRQRYYNVEDRAVQTKREDNVTAATSNIGNKTKSRLTGLVT